VPAQQLAPELIIFAARGYPLAGDQRQIEAVAIRGGQILALGTRPAMRALAGRGTRVMDLGDAVFTPGVVDCHTHFFYWALRRALVIDVTGLPTLEATLARIRAESVRRTVGEWVVAAGFDQNRWGRDFPQAADLDQAVSQRPALVRSRDGHTAWLNTMALKRVGIGDNTPDPPGGCYLRDAHGRLSGIVQEAAADRLPDPVRDFALRTDAAAWRTIDQALQHSYRTAWSFGVVGLHCMDDAASLFHFQRQRRAGQLGLRVVHAVPLSDLAQAAAAGFHTGVGDEWLRIGAIKIFADGALGSQTAFMFDEYPGRPGYCGVPVLAGATLENTVVEAARQGWAVWIHAIGDRAVCEAIDAIAAARRVEGEFLRHRIEHAQCVRPADVRRLAEYRIAASVQPCHLLADIAVADRHWPEARSNAYPFRRMLDAAVTLAAGSDVPIESLDPRRSFFAATCRTDADGVPPGGWFADQKISAGEVLRAFTVGAAASVGAAPPAGTLAPGAAADLTIWEKDPLTVPPEELREIGIRGCVVDGQVHLTEESARRTGRSQSE
jgi:predicted amidohydrolase YtcJ